MDEGVKRQAWAYVDFYVSPHLWTSTWVRRAVRPSHHSGTQATALIVEMIPIVPS